ncbi:MAG: hypothetical protein ACJAVK_002876 [Akkermansiaceae bacterium]|jgi:hypothetical protein
MDLDLQNKTIRAKVSLAGVPGSGKLQILQDCASRLSAGGPVLAKIGDSKVWQASFHWDNSPLKTWALQVDVYTTQDEIPFSAVHEIILGDADAAIFVVPAETFRSKEARDSLFHFGSIMARHGRGLTDIPLVMHYHQVERNPSFDAEILSDFLGVPRGLVPYAVTRSDDGSSLTDSLSLMVQQIVERAKAELAAVT